MTRIEATWFDITETNRAVRELIELDPEDILTTGRAAELLEPLITPLPPFDDSLLPRTPRPRP